MSEQQTLDAQLLQALDRYLADERPDTRDDVRAVIEVAAIRWSLNAAASVSAGDWDRAANCLAVTRAALDVLKELACE